MDFFVSGDGQCQIGKSVREWNLIEENPYRLYRFLTELEDLFAKDFADESGRLAAIRLLVRKLIVNCYWVQAQRGEPCPQTGVSVVMLYDELGFPWTVQTVTFAPGTKSTIHNHGSWGAVALLQGREKNTFWRPVRDPSFPARIEPVGEKILGPGDIISFAPDAIHSVESLGDSPTVTFNIYGETNHSQRFEFDPVSHTAKNF